jgi:hypothetical protein
MEFKTLFAHDNHNTEFQINYNQMILLDNTYEKITHIPNLKTDLFLHQQTVVKAMVDLENNTLQKFKDSKVRVTCGVLTEPVGSGKTIDILSVILLQSAKLYRTVTSSHNLIWLKKYKRVLKPTLIFVSSSVINQWAEAILKFTDLKFFTVTDLTKLTTLLDMIYDGAVNAYDIILVKNGTVARLPCNFGNGNPYVSPYSILRSTPYIHSIISAIDNVCWHRVVIDDFDVIKLPRTAEVINSSFTWYVSSTKKNSIYYEEGRLHNIENTTNFLLNYSPQCYKILNTKIIYNNFNIRNTTEFIQQSNELSSPMYFIHDIPNKDNKIIKALGDLNIPEMNIVAEMLNANAIGNAAEKIGIKTTNVIDIFEHILGEQYKAFKEAISILRFIETQRPKIETLNSPPNGLTYKKEDLLAFKQIEYKYTNIKTFLSKYEEQYQNIKSSSSGIIERVRSNLQEGECPICVNDLNDQKGDIIIFKCCNAIICGQCCFGAVFKKDKYISTCANCRAPTNIKEIVYLNNLDFEYDKLLKQFTKENIDSVILEENAKIHDKKCEDKCEDKCEEPPAEKRTKFTAILDILKSEHNGKEVALVINNLMTGPNDQPLSDKKKILIFGNYDSPLEEFLKSLEDLNFKLLFLKGSYKQLSEISREFGETKENCLLFINSMNHCSGLNLQTATELIFTHRISDANIESQVIGRAQRLYRKNKLQIHYVLYENELEHMNINYL